MSMIYVKALRYYPLFYLLMIKICSKSPKLIVFNNTMNQELVKVTLWLAANKLSLKVGKANFMIFKSKSKNVQHKVPVNIADQNIKQVDHTKFLGVYIDQKFCWKFHIKYMFQ